MFNELLTFGITHCFIVSDISVSLTWVYQVTLCSTQVNPAILKRKTGVKINSVSVWKQTVSSLVSRLVDQLLTHLERQTGIQTFRQSISPNTVSRQPNEQSRDRQTDRQTDRQRQILGKTSNKRERRKVVCLSFYPLFVFPSCSKFDRDIANNNLVHGSTYWTQWEVSVSAYSYYKTFNSRRSTHLIVLCYLSDVKLRFLKTGGVSQIWS